jgi:hypothetical protein
MLATSSSVGATTPLVTRLPVVVVVVAEVLAPLRRRSHDLFRGC